LPLVAPGLVATSVFAFIFAWNEFVFALTFLGTDTAKYTLPIYVQYFYGRGSVDWGGIMAASTLFTIPVMVFFLIVQRRMVNGLVAGAVKEGAGTRRSGPRTPYCPGWPPPSSSRRSQAPRPRAGSSTRSVAVWP